jgi:TonB dependent receptor
VKGAHSVRIGGEFRRSNSHKRDQWLFNPTNFQWGDSFAEIQGGELPGTPQTFTNVDPSWGADSLAGSDASSGNKRQMRDMLIFLSGSLATIKQVRYINSIEQGEQGIWNDTINETEMDRNTTLKEFSFFAKDDWKIRPNLTLNLGVRWDYYGVPYLANGMTVSLEGGGSNIFGPTDNYSNWFAPIGEGDTPTGDLVSLVSVGPKSSNPDQKLYPRTWTNVGPAVGFAYELPWFGKGKTTIRGGYQRSFVSMSGNFQYVESAAGSSPGFFNINNWNNGGAWAANDYFGIKDLKTNPLFQNGVPISVQSGLTEFPIYDRQQSLTTYSSDYGYPHIDNLIFAITRNVTSSLTVDLRYIGTLTRRNFSSRDINVANFISNGLAEAFDAARAGQNPVLLDDLLHGVALVPWGCTIDGDTCMGGEALRNANFWQWGVPAFAPGWFTNMNSMLANGNYQALANALNYIGTPGAYGQYMVANGFPVNFIKASPQFSSATFYENLGYSNYHSFQAQVTLRPTHGINFQSTYTWSKNLGNSGGLSPDPRNLATGYTLLSSDREHNWVTYGNFDLPFGPGKSVGKDTHGVLAKVIEGWQMGWITSVISGAPLAATANCGLYANCTPDEVNGGIDPNSAAVSWPNGADSGSLFANRYVATPDPQCAGIWDPSLCTLTASMNSETQTIVLQNPMPGTMGTMGFNKFRDHGRWNVDLSISKAVTIDETRSFRFRADISNIFNHPMASGVPAFGNGTRVENAGPPSMTINSSLPIGYYDRKIGGRTFQAMLRFDF